MNAEAKRLIWLMLLTIGIYPASFCFSLQYAHLTSYSAVLGVDASYSSFIWLCGPVTGMLVQPIIGRISDNCYSKLGRRRPFALVGGVFLIISEFLIAWSLDIGFLFGDRGSSHTYAIVLLVISFWIFDASNNVLAIAFRALVSDLVPVSHIQLAFSMQQIWSSLGYISGYLTSQVNWATQRNIPEYFVRATLVCPAECITSGDPRLCPIEAVIGCFDIRFNFVIGALVTFFCVLLVCLVGKEEILTRHPDSPSNSLVLLPFAIRRRLLPCCDQCFVSKDEPSFPPDFNVIYTASMLSWFGWFSALVYQVHFIATEVPAYLGSVLPPIEQQIANRQAYFGLMLGSILSGISSFILPFLVGKSPYFIWSCSCALLCCILGFTPIILISGSIILGVYWLASFGIVYAVTNSIPYSLISTIIKEQKDSSISLKPTPISTGRLLGLLNMAVCIPQIITSILGGPLNGRFHSDIPCFLIGSLCAAGAAIVLWKRHRTISLGYSTLVSIKQQQSLSQGVEILPTLKLTTNTINSSE